MLLLLLLLAGALLLPSPLLARTENLKVSSFSEDDASEREGDGAFWYESNYLYIQSNSDPGNRYSSGLRFRDVQIPQYATIVSAKLRFPDCYFYDDPNFTLYANGDDDIEENGAAADFATNPNIIDDTKRARTSASVSVIHTSVPDDYTIEEDLKEVIQEVVDRETWHSGQPLVLLLIGNNAGSDEYWPYSYDQDPSLGAELEITYTVPHGDPMIGYVGDNSGVEDPKYSEWDGTTWPDGLAHPAVDDGVSWVVTKADPVSKYKKIIGVVDEGFFPRVLYVSLWDGFSWHDGTGGDSKNMGSVENPNYRCFDIAYEANSGRALVVASTGYSAKYWIWDGTSWVVDGTSFSPGSGSSNIYWVQLASRPNSNEIAMITAEQGGNVYGNIWDGTQWTGKQILESAASDTTKECIGVEYIRCGTNEGKAMFVWGAGGQELQSRIWDGDGSGWEAEITPAVNLGMQIRWLSLKADPSSNKLVLIATGDNSGNYVKGMIWDGTSWESPEEFGTANTINTRCADAAFYNDGYIMAVYADGSSYLKYERYLGSSWIPGDFGYTIAEARGHWVQVEHDNNELVHLAIEDRDHNLDTWSWPYNGTSWESEKTLGTLYGTAYPMGFMITPPPVVSNVLDITLDRHSADPLTDQFDGPGTEDEALLFLFKLTNNTCDTVSVDRVNFQLSNVSGISASDFSDLRIEYGYIKYGEGDDTVSIVSGSGSIEFEDTASSLFSIPAGQSREYALFGDVSNLEIGDTVTIDLGTTDIDLASGGSIDCNYLPSTVTHTTEEDALPVWIDSISNRDPLFPTSSRNIVRDANGYWYVVYKDKRLIESGMRYQIWLARTTDRGYTWDKVKLCGDTSGGTETAGIVRADNNYYYDPAIDINRDRDTIHIVWDDDSDLGIHYTRCSDLSKWNQAEGWTTAGGVTGYERISANESCENPAIAVDSNAKPHVVYVALSKSYLKYDSFDTSASGAWKGTDVVIDDNTDTTYRVDYPSIDVDTRNYVHIAYWHEDDDYDECINYSKSGNNTDYSSFLAPLGIINLNWGIDPVEEPSLAVDYDDNIYVVTADRTNGAQYYNYYDSSSLDWKNDFTPPEPDPPYQNTYCEYNTVLSVNWGGNDHYVLQMHNSDPYYPLYYYQWDADGESFSGTRTNTGNNATDSYASENMCIEKHKKGSFTEIGYVWFNNSNNKLYFDTLSAAQVGSTEESHRSTGSIVENTGELQPTDENFQRKALFANGRFWIFYCDGNDMVYNSSTDGSNWGNSEPIRKELRYVADGYDFSVWFDGTYVHYAAYYRIGNDLFYRRGLPNSDGTIDWDNEQTVTDYLERPSICIDSEAYPWIGYSDGTSSGHAYVTKSSTNDGTWTTDSAFPYRLNEAETSERDWYVSVVPLTNGKVYATYAHTYARGAIYGKLWNGSSWGPEEAIEVPTTEDVDYPERYSVVADGDDVNILYQRTGGGYNNIYYKKRTAGEGWGSEVLVREDVGTTCGVTLSLDDDTGDLICIFGAGATGGENIERDTIYYKKCIDGTWESSATKWLDESAQQLIENTGECFSAFYRDYGDYTGLLYTTGTSSTYTIKFAYLYYHPIEYPIILGGHSSGQVSDRFDETSPVTDVLFRFRLTGDDGTQVTALNVNYTTDSGVVDDDLTGAALYVDVNNDGEFDGGDTPIQSSVNGANGQLNFTTSFTPSSGGTNYLVRVTVSDLVNGDSTTFSIGNGDITLSGGTVGGVPPDNASHTLEVASLNHGDGNMAIGFPHQRKVVRDALGYWYAVWMDYNGSNYEIFMSKSNNTSGTSWSAPVELAGDAGIVFTGSNSLYWPAIDIHRAGGTIHLIFHEQNTSDLLYSKCTDLFNWNQSASWTQVDGETSPRYDIVTGTAYFGTTTPLYAGSIAVDSTGKPHVVWLYKPSSYVWPYYRYGSGSGFSGWEATVQLDSSSDYSRPVTVEVDSADVVHVVWSEHYTTNYSNINHRSAPSPYTSTDFTAEETIIDSVTSQDLLYLSMAADDEGNVHVICENESLSEIWGAYYNGSTWAETEGIDALGWDKPMVGVRLGAGMTTDVIIAPTDTADPDDLYYWTWNGSAWNQPETDAGNDTDSFVSLEKAAPASTGDMGYLYFDSTNQAIAFDRIFFVDLLLSENDSGQVSDQFYDSSSQNDATLFRFQLENTTGSDLAITQIQFDLSSVYEIYNIDLSDLRLHDGTNYVGGTGTPSIAGDTGTITFSTSFSVPANSIVDYTLFGDLSTLVGGDTLTVGLDSDGISTAGSKAGFVSTATHTADYEMQIQPGGSADDTYVNWQDFATMNIASTTVQVTSYSSSSFRYHGGVRFPGINVPQGSTINRATLSGYVRTDGQDINCTVYGHDTDNAQDFQTNQHVIDTGFRPRTSNSAPWILENASAGWQSIDVSAVVQQLINRGTWTSGNAIALLLIGNSDSYKTVSFRSYDYSDGSLGMRLSIDWSPPPEVLLGAHTATQLDDGLDDEPVQTAVHMYRFQLQNVAASDIAINRITFRLSDITGISDETSDLSNMELYEDTGGDGTPDILKSSGPVQIAINEGAGTGTIMFDDGGGLFTVPMGQTVDYILMGDAANLERYETFTIALSPNDIVTESEEFAGGNPTGSVVHFVDPTQVDKAFDGDNNTIPLEWPTQRKLVRDLNGYWYVVYVKMNGARYEVILARSTDQIPDPANTWDKVTLFGSGGVILDDNTKDFKWPAIDVKPSRDELHVVALDDTTSPRPLYYAKCTDLSNWNAVAGWSAEEQVTTFADSYIHAPVIAVESDGDPHFAYMKEDAYGTEIVYRTKQGDTWGGEITIEDSDLFKQLPSIDIGQGDVVHIAYEVESYGVPPDDPVIRDASGAVPVGWMMLVHHKKSTDYINFSDYNWVMGNGLRRHYGPSIAARDDTDEVWIVEYQRYASLDYELQFVYSTDGGESWSDITYICQDSNYRSYYPSVGTNAGSYTDHKVMGPSWDGNIRYFTWDTAPEPDNFTNRTETVHSVGGSGGDTTNDTSLEKHKPLTSKIMGYVWYDAARSQVCFDYFETQGPDATLAEHDSGQLTDQLGDLTSYNDIDLFRFRLTNNRVGSSLTVDQLVFQLSGITGTFTLDDLKIYAGETLIASGGVADLGAGTITFTEAFTIDNPGEIVNFTLKGDADGLDIGETFTISLGTDDITLNPVADVLGTPPTPVTHASNETVTIGNHTNGQAENQFDGNSSQDNLSLFKFQLINQTAADVTISQVQFQLSAIDEIYSGDLNNLVIHDDTGAADVAAATCLINGETGTITTSGSFVLPAGETRNYTLIGDADNLAKADTVTISLGTTNITLPAPGRMGGASPVDATHTVGQPPTPSEVDGGMLGNLGYGYYALGFPGQRKLVRDADGYWYAVWGAIVGGQYRVYFNKSVTTDGSAWSVPVVLFGNGGIVLNDSADYWRYPSIDINWARNEIHLVVQRDEVDPLEENEDWADDLCYSKCTDLNSWNQASAWKNLTESGSSYDLIVDTTNLLFDGTTVLYGPKYGPSIAVGDSSDPHVGYCTWAGEFATESWKPRYIHGTESGGWESVVEVDNPSGSYAYPTVEVDAAGTVHFFADTSPDTTAQIRDWTAISPYTSFNTPVHVIGTTQNLQYISAAADTQGNVHFVTHEADVLAFDIWTAYYDGSSWTTSENMDAPSFPNWQIHDVGARGGSWEAGDVVLSSTYKEAIGEQGIFYWLWGGSAWRQPETNTGNDCYEYLSLEKRAPDRANDMGYLFWDKDNQKLHFARITFDMTPILVYSEDAADNLNYSKYVPWDWTDGTAAVTQADNFQWMVSKTKQDYSESVAVFVEENSTQPHLYVSFWDGYNWDDGNGEPYGDAYDLGAIRTDDYRCFDAAYENASGELLIVASHYDTTNKLNYFQYWVWDGSSWTTGEHRPWNSGDNFEHINWVRMASQPDTNQIALMMQLNRTAGGYEDVLATMWDGDTNTWDTNAETQLSPNSNYEVDDIAVEYVQCGTYKGWALFAFAQGRYVYAKEWDGTDWVTKGDNWAITSSQSVDHVYWLRLAPDPNSSRMLIAWEHDDGTYPDIGTTAVYDFATSPGFQVMNCNEHETYGLENTLLYNRAFDIIYEAGPQHSGHAIIVYTDDDSATGDANEGICFRHFDGTSWGEEQVIDSSKAHWVQLHRSPDNTIHLAAHTTTNTLKTWSWDGTEWVFEKEISTTLEPGPNNHSVEAFAFADYITPGTAGAAPDIISLDYNSGTVGSTITICGTNFGNVPGTVTINGVEATIWSWSDTEIVITVPAGSTDGGYVVVTTPDGSDSTANIPYDTFDVITEPPSVTSIIPNKGSNFSDIDITEISGDNISPDATVHLVKSGKPKIVGNDVKVKDKTKIKGNINYEKAARFNIAQAESGNWSVEITNPDGQSATLSNGFAVHTPITAATGGKADVDSLDYNNSRRLVRDSAGYLYAVFEGGANVYITRSTDGGQSWDEPTKLVGAVGGFLDTSYSYTGVSVAIGNAPVEETAHSIVAEADAWISDGVANSGGQDAFLLNALPETRAILRFDLSGIPAGEEIIGVTLNAYCYTNTFTSDTALGAYRVDHGTPNYETLWVEGTGTTSNGIDDGVTWYRYDDTNNWATAGGDMAGTPTDTATLSAATTGWYSWDVTADCDAKEMRSWILKYPSITEFAGTEWRSKEYGDANFHPYLEVVTRTTGGSNSDRLHVVWTVGTGGVNKYIRYSRCNDLANYTLATSWTQVDGQTSPFRYETLDSLGTSSTDYFHGPDIAVDSEGNPHVTFFKKQSVTEFISYRTSRTSTSNPKDWDDMQYVTTSSSESGYSDIYDMGASIDVDSNDYAHVAWSQRKSPIPDQFVVRYAKSTDWVNFPSGNKVDIISGNEDMHEPSLAVDSDDRVYVVCEEDDFHTGDSHDLWWAYFDGSSWSTNNNLTNGDIDIESPVVGIKLATDGSANHILLAQEYSAVAENKKVIFWKWNGTLWDYATDPDTGNESRDNVSIEKHSPANADNVGYLFYDGTSGDLYYDGDIGGLGVTLVDLTYFAAQGAGDVVTVEWETAQEIDNAGYNVYRSESAAGAFEKLNDALIPGAFSSLVGRQYFYEDSSVALGQLYYYKLEAVDTRGVSTWHGPICVDWDADGLPDDWEIAHGLDTGFDDSGVDSDGDGLSNRDEYESGTDPMNPDSDGDGTADGEESYWPEGEAPIRTFTDGVVLMAEDDNSITLELRTDTFDLTIVPEGEEIFQRLRVQDYIHGLTDQVGKPELPMKGVLVDLPADSAAGLSVELVEEETYEGYWIYPVPEKVVVEEGNTVGLTESFYKDEEAYATDSFYSDLVAQLGEVYTFRDQQRLQLIFYPFAFNPATGQLKHYTRIRVRIDYYALPPSGEATMGAAEWSPPEGSSSFKLSVQEEGMYQLTEAFLTAGGVDVASMALDEVRLYHLGEEVAIYVYDAMGDNRLDDVDGDYIAFYGQPVSYPYSKFTRDNIYWLTPSGGAGAPKRMQPVDGTPAGGSLAAAHTDTAVENRDEYYWIMAPGGDELDRWVDDTFTPGGGFQNYTIEATSVAMPPAEGSLTLELFSGMDTDHEVDITVNGTFEGTHTWSNISRTQFTLDSVNVVEGVNTITIDCISSPDVIAVDVLTLDYPRTFQATGDRLRFSHPAGYRYQVSGLSTDQVLVFDITSPTDVGRVSNAAISDPPAPHSVEFEPAGTGTRSYIVTSPAAMLIPTGITPDTPSDLAAVTNGADYILITHRELGWDGFGDPYPWLDPLGDETSSLLTLRQNQGLRVKVVDVQDIYDEFSYGIFTPQAIRDFLSYTYQSWTPPAPRYVLLVGESTYDYKDNFGYGTTQYVPVHLFYTQILPQTETVSDEWFVQVAGSDAVPDMHIGRLPAGSAAEASAMVEKILTYETTANTKDWEKNIVLIADDQAQPAEIIFEIMNEDVAATIPAAGFNAPLKFYQQDYVGDITQHITDQINLGALIVHYSGHASIEQWAAGPPLYTNADAAALVNQDRMPFVISMSCLAGNFSYPEDPDSMAEAFLQNPAQGAVAAFMPTDQTEPVYQRIMDLALFEAFFDHDLRLLGPAVSEAKQVLLANSGYQYQEVSDTFLLFGDPAMELKIPLPKQPTGLTAEGSTDTVSLTWDAPSGIHGAAVESYNIYRSTSPGSGYVKINDQPVTGTSFVDTSCEDGVRYYYVLTSLDDEGIESSMSQEASADTSPASSHDSSSGGTTCFVAASGKGGPSTMPGWLTLIALTITALLLCSHHRGMAT
jgi:hypothetical protein